jgi:hypothetical protein
MNNIHGDRINNDLPQRKGSGYVATHGHDFLVSADPWYQGLLIKYGPDGAVYVADWYDIGECHTLHPHTDNGRIYKITYQGTPRVPPFDLTKMTSAQLVDLQLHRNDWWVRRARRILQERGPDPAVHSALLKMLKENPDLTRRLRALWALHDTGGATTDLLRTLLHDPSEYLRAWAVQLLTEDRNPSAAVLTDFTHLAADDPSPMVRLYLASAMTRIPVTHRWQVLEKLVSHPDDVSDQNLPLMYWYALEPMTVSDGKRALALAIDSKIPKLREFVSRRLAETTRKEHQN